LATKQTNFYASDKVQEWLDALPQRGKTRAINAALEQHIAQQAEGQTLLDLLREAVNSLDGLTEVAAGLAAAAILSKKGADDDELGTD
jgi:hypothetical protein